MKTKKGQAISGLHAVITALVAVAIVLAIGFLIFSETTTQIVDKIATVSVLNESVTFVDNGTYIALEFSPDALELSCTSINADADNASYCAPEFYTCTIQQGLLFENKTLGCFTNTTPSQELFVNYSYKLPDKGYNSSVDVTNATADIATWLPIFVITIIGGVLLALVALFRRAG